MVILFFIVSCTKNEGYSKVPTAIIKGMEVACGLALPKDVGIRIEKE